VGNRVTFVDIERTGTHGEASVQIRDDSARGRLVRVIDRWRIALAGIMPPPSPASEIYRTRRPD
jgi:hypothetical protein